MQHARNGAVAHLLLRYHTWTGKTHTHTHTSQYKKGLKAADAVLKKFPNHGETQAMKGLTLNCLDRKPEVSVRECVCVFNVYVCVCVFETPRLRGKGKSRRQGASGSACMRSVFARPDRSGQQGSL